MNHRQESLIRDFVKDVGVAFTQVRGVKLANELRATEIRSKKHDHLAIHWDELGNAFVLTARGQRLNLLHNEIG